MTSTGDAPEIWRSTRVYGSRLGDAPGINDRILTAFAALNEEDFSRRTHFFGGRFENLYLDRGRIPELHAVLEHADACAREVLDWGPSPLRSGFWFNAQAPGQSTSEHTHQELDELLSGVYYLSAPQGSGDILLQDGLIELRVRPEAGLFLFFPPNLSHRVETNRSDQLRLSLAFNFGPATAEETD